MANTWQYLVIGAILAILIAIFIFPSSLTTPKAVPTNPSCLGILLKEHKDSLDLEFPNVVTDTNLRLRVETKLREFRCRKKTELSIEFPGEELRVVRKPKSSCYDLQWSRLEFDDIAGPSMCFRLANGQHVFGGGTTYDIRWPSSRQSMTVRPFYSTDLLFQTRPLNHWGSLLERYWVTADGFMINVDDSTPLYVGINNETLCVQSKYEDGYRQCKNFVNKRPLSFSATICSAPNIKEVYMKYLRDDLGRAFDLPDMETLRRPIWSTWVRFRTNINDKKVIKFAEEITTHKFPRSFLEIDDKYSPTYGDFSFDKVKFPNATATVRKLHDHGFRVSAWITPFANKDSAAFEEGQKKEFWLKNRGTSSVALIKWWQGAGALLDVTNPAAREWFINRLTQFKNATGLDGFKFDGGETNYLLDTEYVAKGGPLMNMNNYGTLYAKMAATSGLCGEVRIGHRSQALSLVLRMFDKQSIWGAENGLRSIIPHALLSAMLGYSLVLPDMIGGNAYDVNDLPGYKPPDRELYIRWLQVTAFLPVMQFSIPPWDYDDEVVRIARNHVHLHEEVVFEHMKETLMTSTVAGIPVIRPLWWIEPKSEDALTLDDQFLIGDCLLVAPVVFRGMKSRDVYLPKGQWRDGNAQSRTIHEGPRWLRDYPAPLNVTPWFECP